MKIVIGADHRGFARKEFIKKNLGLYRKNIEFIDVGTFDDERSDYPIFAKKACLAIKSGQADYGILLCSTGIGMSIVANRFPGIYAALAWNSAVARMSKEDDNANVLVLPSDFITDDEAIQLLMSWINASFRAGRYQNRLDMIDAS